MSLGASSGLDITESTQGPPIGEAKDDSWYANPYRELDRTSDTDRFVESESEGDYPVYGGKNVYQFVHDSTYFDNPTEDDLQNFPLHSAYERTYSDEELFAALGMIDSIPFDFLLKTKVDTHIVMYKFTESQVPRLTEGDEWFEYIWTRAARLNCYGEEFEEMRDRLGGIEPVGDMDERREVQAELDAAAFHAYGLDREQAAFVLDDFHRVQDPRLMDDDYFETVLEKYDDLD